MLGKTKVEIAKRLGTILYRVNKDSPNIFYRVETDVYAIADTIGGIEMMNTVELYYDGLKKGKG